MYKKLLLICVSAITIQTAKAQTEKGSQMIGVGFGFSTASSDSKSFDTNINTYGSNVHTKTTSYNFSPNYSYFIADNLDLGFNVGYGRSKQESTDNSGLPSLQKTHGFGAGAYLRKYVLFENKIGIRTGPYVNYSYGKQEASYGSSPSYYSYTNKIYVGGVGLDFIYFPVKKLALAARLGNLNYVYQTTDGSNKGTYKAFNLNFVDAVDLSVSYVF